VLVLGPTGVNFAAGMSGGVAWVLDDDGTFTERCNQELVDLEPPAPEDYPELRDLLAEHHARTDSTHAADLLADESSWATRLVRVMPRDYRAALQRAAEEDDRRAEGAPA
jgi:glutamate synthase domain-containing protein 3